MTWLRSFFARPPSVTVADVLPELAACIQETDPS